MTAREYNFDCLVGPTHHYAGLSYGNLASVAHRGTTGNPKSAALEGLEKMRFVASLGVGQGVLPPQLRPNLSALRRLGFSGTDAAVLESAAKHAPEILHKCSSASAMWAANAATVAPSSDTNDAHLHLTPANLVSMFHRSLEAERTTHVLREIFADRTRFTVHEPLPPNTLFSDEGAANHTRLTTDSGTVHLFGWGRSSTDSVKPELFPARQTLEASTAIARLHELGSSRYLLWQQDPRGIDAGAFHSDVLAVGNRNFLMLHELAFREVPALLVELKARLGGDFCYCLVSERELPAREAVAAYPFNSQLVMVPSGEMVLIAPRESESTASARRFLERVVAEDNPVSAIHYVDVNGSMKNGGGPACLRLRVVLNDEERQAIRARIFLDDDLYALLKAWIEKHYRDRLSSEDLADPALLDETRRALDELGGILGLPDLALE